MAIETAPFDAADYLTDGDAICAYLTEALSENPEEFVDALRDVLRAQGGIGHVAETIGWTEEKIAAAVESSRVPFSKVVELLRAMHIQLRVRSQVAEAQRTAA
jgi:DNA-binding phage protein